MPLHVNLAGSKINLPFVGSVAITTVLVGGIALWFFLRKRKPKRIIREF